MPFVFSGVSPLTREVCPVGPRASLPSGFLFLPVDF